MKQHVLRDSPAHPNQSPILLSFTDMTLENAIERIAEQALYIRGQGFEDEAAQMIAVHESLKLALIDLKTGTMPVIETPYREAPAIIDRLPRAYPSGRAE